jgi:hypothetical protein
MFKPNPSTTKLKSIKKWKKKKFATVLSAISSETIKYLKISVYFQKHTQKISNILQKKT